MILLDTHAWFWSASEPHRLSEAGKAAIQEARRSDGIVIASISLWELAFLIARGRVELHGSTEASLNDLVEATGVIVREITPTIATLATQFPDDFPGDPGDRLIAATAVAEGVPLVTKDRRLRASHAVRTIW